MLIAFRLRRRDPERDIRDFEAGLGLRVLCLTFSFGGERGMKVGGARVAVPKPGYLHLTKGEPVVWRRIRTADSLTKYGSWLMSASGLVRRNGRRVPLPKPGDRFLHEGVEKSWRASRGADAAEIPAQGELRAADRKVSGVCRAVFTVDTSGGPHDIAVPPLDVELVRHALR